MSDRPVTPHELRSALQVARLIDLHGNSVSTARLAYQEALTQGEHPSSHLANGETVLVRAGLLRREGDRLSPSESLTALAALDDGQALAALETLLPAEVQQHPSPEGQWIAPGDVDPNLLKALGDRGEDYVVNRCRAELEALESWELAKRVQRASLISDSLGYDVYAPAVRGNPRLLEVKTSPSTEGQAARFYLSRNEYEVGRRSLGWSLVFCVAPNGLDGDVEVVGWCPADALRPYLPEDRNGRWTEALLRLPLAALNHDIPPAL